MSTKLGTLEELPPDYREAMSRVGVAPLWPQMRNVLPHGGPEARDYLGFDPAQDRSRFHVERRADRQQPHWNQARRLSRTVFG